MKRENISKALDGVDEHLVVEAAEKLHLVGDAPTVQKRKGQNAFVRFMNSGWGVAAVCALVAIGVMGGIIWAGNQPGTNPPIAGTGENETEADVTEPLVIPEPNETETAEETTEPEVTAEETTEPEVTAEETTEPETEPPHEHMLSAWAFTKTPTCTEGGAWERRCTVEACDYVEAQELPAGRHSFNDSQLTCLDCGADAPVMEFTSYGDGTCYVSDRGDVARSIRELTIPSYSPAGDLVIAVGDNVFSDLLERCSTLTLSEGIERIGARAFAGMPMLKEVHLPSTLTVIDMGAFYYCQRLADVTLPDGLQYLGDSAFEDCKLSASFTLPDSLTYLGHAALSGVTGLESIHLPASLTFIGERALANARPLQEITFDENIQITSIPTGFANQCKFTSIRIPDSVTSIGSNAFFNCDALREIVLPDGLTEIGGSAFNGCAALTTVDLPATLTTIGGHAFANCTALTSLSLPESVTSVGMNVFENSTVLSYQSYRGCLYLPVGDNPYALLVRAENTEITAVEFHPDVKVLMGGAFENCEQLTEVTIPDGQTAVPERCFFGCSALRSIHLPDSVTSIGDHAFYQCSSLAELPTSANLSAIGSYAFAGCHGLTEILLPETITEVGAHAFASCGNLLSATLPNGMTTVPEGMFYQCPLLEKVTLPESIVRIESQAFGWMDRNNATYLEINIPKSVTYIGERAFSDSTAVLRYDGTWEEFNAIEQGESCFGGLGNASVTCSDGSVYLG